MKDPTLLSINYDGATWCIESDNKGIKDIMEASGLEEELVCSTRLASLVDKANHIVETYENRLESSLDHDEPMG